MICGLDQKTPELADKVMPAMESFVEKQWQEREKGLKIEIQQLKLEVLRTQEEDSMETSPQLNYRVQRAQTYDSDASSKSSSDDASHITIVECRYVSKISYPIRPPLFDSLSPCMAVDTWQTSLSASMAISDIVLNIMPRTYTINSMAQVRDNHYVMSTSHDDSSSIYGIDIVTRDVNVVTAYIGGVNIVTRGNIVVTLNYKLKPQ